jgi:hypothetical protein
VAEGIPTGDWRHTLPAPDVQTDVVLVAGTPVASPDARSLVAAGVPHLAVSLVDGIAIIGPFVRPGRTACLGCVDRTRVARDPAWPALVQQLGPDLPAPAVHDLPAPRSRVLQSAAATWAVRDLLAHLAGDRVLCYGSSLRFADDLVEQVVHRWELHPGCECCLLS